MLCSSHGHNATTKAIGNIVNKTLAVCSEAAVFGGSTRTTAVFHCCQDSTLREGVPGMLRSDWIALPVIKPANQENYFTHHSALECLRRPGVGGCAP